MAETYVTREEVETMITAAELPKFLDDDGDRVEDDGRFRATAEMASRTVDGLVASIYAVPFVDPVPAMARRAALIFFCEALYKKRLTPDEKNPFKPEADDWRERLGKVGSGEIPLDAAVPRVFAPGAAITIDSYLDDNSL